MVRCGCGASCSCLITAGPGTQVDGIGTVENPYVISSESTELLDRIEFLDSPSIDFAQSGIGTLLDPMTVTAVATLAMTDLTDVQGSPSNSQVPVWVVDHWEFQDQSGGGGSGIPPGGLTGQVLTKITDLDGEADWEDPTGGGSAVADPPAYGNWYKNANQPLTHNVSAIVGYDVVSYDAPVGMTMDATGLVTVQTAGLYVITAHLAWVANAVGNRYGWIYAGPGGGQNLGRTAVAVSAAAGGYSGLTIAATKWLNAGDNIKILAYQSSGGNLDLFCDSVNRSVTLEVAKIPSNPPSGGGVVVERPANAMRLHVAGTSILTDTTTAIPFDTSVNADGIAWDVAQSAFIAPSDGYYDVEFGLTYAANATGVRVGYIYVNGVQQTAASDGGSSAAVAGSATVKALAGQTIQIRTRQSSGSSLALVATVGYNWATVTKVPVSYAGSAVSTYGERNYFASRGHGATMSIPNNAQTNIPWDAQVADEGIPWNGTQFVIPVAGYYDVEAMITYTGSNSAGSRMGFIVVNGASVQASSVAPTTGASQVSVALAETVKCAAGDLVEIKTQHAAGVAMTLSGNNVYNRMSITKVPAPVVNGAAASGVWGIGPLAGFGSNDLVGREVYIDSRGQLRTKPETPAERTLRRKSTSQNLTAASTWYTVTFDTDDEPGGSTIPYAAGVFTVPRAGVYLINVMTLFGGITGVVSCRTRIILNGSNGVGEQAEGVNATNPTLTQSRSVRMAAGDTVYIESQVNATGASVVGSAVRYTMIDITRISA